MLQLLEKAAVLENLLLYTEHQELPLFAHELPLSCGV